MKQFQTYFQDRSNYPHPVDEIRVIETHISLVCLTGDFAYKIKKPVKFGGVLDFRDLVRRQEYCTKEFELNQRLAPHLYIGVVSLTDAGISEDLDPKSEYAVKMHEFPQSSIMKEKLEKGEPITKQQLDAIAQRLAEFYAITENVPHDGSIDRIKEKIDENFLTLDELNGIPATYKEKVYRFVHSHQSDFLRRIQDNRIKDGHGDLQPKNIMLVENKIYIFDCIEFNDLLRHVDMAEDIAFLAMELDRYGQTEFSSYFVNCFVDYSGDDQIYSVLNFYKSYRAAVRAKVALFRRSELDTDEREAREELKREALNYLDLAQSYLEA
jgi:aminoglycoside phosphotransferase family enzyme